jgi:hypothetical protein
VAAALQVATRAVFLTGRAIVNCRQNLLEEVMEEIAVAGWETTAILVVRLLLVPVRREAHLKALRLKKISALAGTLLELHPPHLPRAPSRLLSVT